MKFNPAHFPHRAAIDSYGNGGFRFANMSHKGSILCLPSGIYGCEAKGANELNEKNLEPLFEKKENLELLLVGTGKEYETLATGLEASLEKQNIRYELMNTGAAARTFNVLLAEGRNIGAILIAHD